MLIAFSQAALNSKSPFVTPFGREREADVVKRSFKVDNSDFLTICKVYELWRNEVRNGTHFSFCRKNFLSHQVSRDCLATRSRADLLRTRRISRKLKSCVCSSTAFSSTGALSRGPPEPRLGAAGFVSAAFPQHSTSTRSITRS